MAIGGVSMRPFHAFIAIYHHLAPCIDRSLYQFILISSSRCSLRVVWMYARRIWVRFHTGAANSGPAAGGGARCNNKPRGVWRGRPPLDMALSGLTRAWG